MWEAVGWISSIFLVCSSTLVAFRWWMAKQPPCTIEEFRRVVEQCNRLTAAMAEVQQTADSVRSAVGMSRIGVNR